MVDGASSAAAAAPSMAAPSSATPPPGLSFRELLERLSVEHERVLEANWALEQANRRLRSETDGHHTPSDPWLDAPPEGFGDASRCEGPLPTSWPVDVDAPANIPSRLPPVQLAAHIGVKGAERMNAPLLDTSAQDQPQPFGNTLAHQAGDESPGGRNKHVSVDAPRGMKQATSTSSAAGAARRRLPSAMSAVHKAREAAIVAAVVQSAPPTLGTQKIVNGHVIQQQQDEDNELKPRLTMGGSVDLRSLPAQGQQIVDSSEWSSDSEASDAVCRLETCHSGSRSHRGVFGANGMRSSLTQNSDDLAPKTPASGGVKEKNRINEMSARRFSTMAVQMIKASASSARKNDNRTWFQRHLINPEHSKCLQTWDLITLGGLGFVALVTPVQVSMIEPKLDWTLGVNCLVDLIFLVDLVLQFFLMFPKKTDYGYALESDHRKIVRAYLKSWFIIDLLSIIPFDMVGLISENDGLQQMKVVKVIRLMRLLKLVRMLKASRLFRRFEVRMSITYGTFALLKFFVILLLITHWLANLWALTLVLVDESDGVPRWIDGFAELETNVVEKTKDTPWKLYIVCLYFTSYTITSVGYGDIGPQNIVETIVCTMMIIVAGISWAVVLGEVCGIISNLNSDEKAFRAIMDELNFMMVDRGMTGDMRRRLRNFFLSNKHAQRRARQQRIIEAMSPGLQGEVIMELNRVWITKVSFLNSILGEAEGSSHGSYFYSFVVDVSMRMEGAYHAQSEVFGQMQALYILSRGLVSRAARLQSAGAVWGSDFVLSDLRLLEPADCLALTYVEAMFLRRKAFLELVEQHKADCPGLKRKVRRYSCWLALQRALLKEAKKRRRKNERSRLKREEREREIQRLKEEEPGGWFTPSETRSEESRGEPRRAEKSSPGGKLEESTW